MEGETPPTPPPPAKMARGNQPPPAEVEGETQQPLAKMVGETLPPCVSKVLDDDNLLTEIIVRTGFPTSLVRAAAVCRRWLRLASGRAFLRRFRKLHPPRLLGFYLNQSFFPMLPQPPLPDLAAVVGRASFRLDPYQGSKIGMVGCWNGRVLTSLHVSHENDVRHEIIFVAHSPLCSESGMAVLPALHFPSQEGTFYTYMQLFSKEEGNALSYFYVIMDNTWQGKTMARVYALRNGDDAWRTHLTLTVDYPIHARSEPNGVLLDNSIYIARAWNKIDVLDLTASSVSTIQLPQGVDFSTTGTTMLSRADNASAVCLIHAKAFQIHIWLHKGGGNWLLVDNISLLEMCARLLEDKPSALLRINHAGDYTGEFLFLEMGQWALYLDVKCRTLRKVHEMTKEEQCFDYIYPFMMIWPPIFPMLKDTPPSNAA